MKVELYLTEINQETIGHSFDTDIRNESLDSKKNEEIQCCVGEGCCVGECCVRECCVRDCCVGECCVGDEAFTKKMHLSKENTNKWLLRKEKFGGLIWEPKSGKIFKLDNEAYEFLTDLKNQEKINTVLLKHKISNAQFNQYLKDFNSVGFCLDEIII